MRLETLEKHIRRQPDRRKSVLGDLRRIRRKIEENPRPYIEHGIGFAVAVVMFVLSLYLTTPFIAAQKLHEQRVLARALFGEPESPAFTDVEAIRLMRCRLHGIEFRYRVDYTSPVQSFWERLFNRRPTPEEVLINRAVGMAVPRKIGTIGG